jgi:hypothetical protein
VLYTLVAANSRKIIVKIRTKGKSAFLIFSFPSSTIIRYIISVTVRKIGDMSVTLCKLIIKRGNFGII